MKNAHLLPMLALALLTIGCTTNDLPDAPPQAPEPRDAAYAVGIDEALAHLEGVLDAIDGSSTRSARRRRVGEVKAVAVKGSETRSGGCSGTDSAFYLVNFKDNEGYAILGADRRLAPVVAVIDQGNLDHLTLSLDEDPDELDALDSLDYDPVNDDFLLGATGLPDPRNDYPAYNEGPLNGLLLEYWRAVAPSQPQKTDGIYPVTITGHWEVTGAITPMLKTKWHQKSPFNDVAPIIGNKKAPAGCVPVAVAQIMAYHEYPPKFVDWKVAKTVYNYENTHNNTYAIYADSVKAKGSIEAQSTVSYLLYVIGKDCSVRYGATSSSALPVDAKDCLKSWGYRNVVRHLGYDRVEILKCLERGCPVFIGARRSGSGHAWVIDGYIRRQYVCTGFDTVKQLLMHCNWGFAGDADGYYESELFRTYSGAILGEDSLNEDISDYDGKASESHRYYKVYRIITYDHP